MNQATIDGLREIQQDIHKTANDKGWWDDRHLLVEVAARHSPELGRFARVMVQAANIALMHSELSESLEAARHGNPSDDKIPLFRGVEAEQADTIIRILDDAEGSGHDVIGALQAKMEMNETRTFKHGGKAF